MTTIKVKIDEYMSAFLNTILRDLMRVSSSLSSPTSLVSETGCLNDDSFSLVPFFSFCDSVSDILSGVPSFEMLLSFESSKVAIARVPEKS
jgi:hypothetical protein